jgi:hypothetical protein
MPASEGRILCALPTGGLLSAPHVQPIQQLAQHWGRCRRRYIDDALLFPIRTAIVDIACALDTPSGESDACAVQRSAVQGGSFKYKLKATSAHFRSIRVSPPPIPRFIYTSSFAANAPFSFRFNATTASGSPVPPQCMPGTVSAAFRP